jgi:phosphoribosylaminoimidazolecarboxamide formyltransferase/IMP cyclohydrolase
MSASLHQPRASTAPDIIPIRRALISLTDKSGIVELATELTKHGVDLLSTGGTLKVLQQAGLPARDVSEYTGFPEMLDGRVKTLHPKVHGGILAQRDLPEHQKSMQEHAIEPIDAVFVNLYNFAAAVAQPNMTDALAVENIDIGGPSLIRGAAKNHPFVAIVTSPTQYTKLAEEIREHGGTTMAFRRELAAAAFKCTAEYDTAIAAYFAKTAQANGNAAPAATFASPAALDQDWDGNWPVSETFSATKVATLRYGENPHQSAALYAKDHHGTASHQATVLAAKQLHGKELSYNNLLDLDAAWGIVRMLDEPAAVVIKHNNPCGAAMHGELAQAMRRAWAGDPVSAFGSVLALNRVMDAATADVLAEPDRFVEAIIAPGFSPDAFTILTTKPKWKANVRLLEIGSSAPVAPQPIPVSKQFRQIDGGWLAQDSDTEHDHYDDWKVVTSVQLSPALEADLRFAWSMMRHVKSNAILLAKDKMVLGVGAGQMSRVDSVEISIRKAGERAKGAVVASDAFFPFADSIALIRAAGIVAVIQPGGSKRDDEVIAACNDAGIPMIFTGRRHFKH